MHSENYLVPVVSILFLALAGGWLLDRLRQPAIMGYILAGVVLSSIFGDYLPDKHIFEIGGETGLILMLFFIGSEVDIRKLIGNWKISLIGTSLQIGISVGITLALGAVLQLPLQQSLFFGFIISLSSTAVVLKLLEEFGGQQSAVGKHCLGILLAQDFAIVPMMILLSLVGGKDMDSSMVMRQIFGGIILVALGIWMSMRGGFNIPQWTQLHNKRDFQIFAGLLFCLGSASITGLLGLSPALGSFLAGMALGSSEQKSDLRRYLEPFRILFVAVFFVFVGILFDISFFMEHFFSIIGLVLLVFLLNTVINAAILRALGINRITAMITGCMLAQIGEFAFLLSASAYQSKIIDNTTYQTVIAVITLTLLLTPIWIYTARRFMKQTWGESGTQMFDTTTLYAKNQHDKPIG
jgi:monovalent cation:H+ antiporter-2, CPA2 family